MILKKKRATIKKMINEGKVGEVISISATEHVGWWHQAHSFVRGKWRSSDTTSPMILAKCCHDMDLWVWLTGRRCVRVSSFGSLGSSAPSVPQFLSSLVPQLENFPS